jgi:hypothetical protein
MATYEITSPDGQKYRVSAPDGASQDEVLSYAQRSFKMAAAPDAFERTAKAGTGFDNLLPAVGGAMTGAYLGGKQMLMKGLDYIDPQSVSRADAMAPDIAENRAAMKGLTSTKMGMAGDVLGNLAMAAPTMMNPAAATMKGAAAIGSAFGAFRPTMGDESRLENMAMGGAMGAGGQWLGNKVLGALVGQRAGQSATGGSATATSSGGASSASSTVTGGATARGTGGGYNFGTVGDDVSAGLNESQRALMERAQALGYKMTPGQASGSKSLQQMEAKLESQPMTSGRFNAIKSHNQTINNRIAADSIGESADVVDATVLAKAHDRISNVYKMVADDTKRAIEPEGFIAKLAGIEDEFSGLLPAGSIINHPLVNRLYGFAGEGGATGRQLQNIASKLGRAAKNEMTGNGDRELGMALSQAKDLADDLLQQGLKGETAALFKTARSQYRNTMLLTDRLGVVNPSNGNVSSAALANVLSKDKSGFMRGGNTSPLYDMARFGQGFKSIAGDSGTATRSALPSPTDFVLSLPFNVATKAYTSQPAINLAARGGDISRNGLLGNLDPETVKYLPQFGAASGMGLLAFP